MDVPRISTWTLPTAQQLTSSTANPLSWPVSSKEKPDLIIFDPPYFDKKAADYDKKSISGLPKKEYLEFLEAFFALLKQNAKKTTRLAFINADWRDFQNKPAKEESPKGAILIDDYLRILNKTGWQHTSYCQMLCMALGGVPIFFYPINKFNSLDYHCQLF